MTSETEEAVARAEELLSRASHYESVGAMVKTADLRTILTALERAETDAAQWKAEAAVTFANGRDALAAERAARERAVRLSTAAAVALAALKAEVVEGVGRADLAPEAICKLAFQIPAPNAITPNLVLVANQLQHTLRDLLAKLKGEG